MRFNTPRLAAGEGTRAARSFLRSLLRGRMPFMNAPEKIRNAITVALQKLNIEPVNETIGLEHPTLLSHGDLATNVALQYAKHSGKSARQLAESIVSELGHVEGVAKVEIAGPGFINFHLSPEVVNESLENVNKNAGEWGKNQTQSGKRVLVEYTDPNPFKEFHIGHLMSNAIGESISRLIEYSGAEVKRANYQGDVGPHVAKALYARTFPSTVDNGVPWGVSYKMGNDLYESDPSHKKAIDEINKKVYARDSEIYSLYEQGRKESLAEFEMIYEKLGMEPRKESGHERFFDYYFFESGTAPIGQELVKSHPEVFSQSDGAVIYRGEADKLHTRVFITSQGLPTYETKELGLAKLKSDTWDFDTSVTITANEQKEYFQVVFAAMQKVLPAVAPKIQHVTHGMMRFAEEKMSSRKGNVITALGLLQDLFEIARERAAGSRAKDTDKLAHDIALAAIKYQILKQASGKDIIFDRERALSLEGDSGPYLQYAHARAHQVVERARGEKIKPQIDAHTKLNDVARLLIRFPEIVEKASRELEPHFLTNFLVALSGEFNSWYAQEQILDGTASAPHKCALTDAVRATLKNGLWLLGIPAPEKM